MKIKQGYCDKEVWYKVYWDEVCVLYIKSVKNAFWHLVVGNTEGIAKLHERFPIKMRLEDVICIGMEIYKYSVDLD